MSTNHLESSYKNKNGTTRSNKVIIEWNAEAIEAFEKLKAEICSDNVLILPNFDEEFFLVTDSYKAYVAVLCQNLNGELKPVAFFSKQINSAQQRYSISEKELLAIVMSIEHFHSYLYGRKFKVHSYHQPLKWLLNKKGVIYARLARWI